MRKLTAAVIVAGTAGALAYPPTRAWLAEVLVVTGIHLENAGRRPGSTDAQARRKWEEIKAIAARADKGQSRRPNGHHPSQPI